MSSRSHNKGLKVVALWTAPHERPHRSRAPQWHQAAQARPQSETEEEETVNNGHLGYVVVEWNQASKRPGIPAAELYGELGDARQARDFEQEATDGAGRRERFTVAEVVEVPDA